MSFIPMKRNTGIDLGQNPRGVTPRVAHRPQSGTDVSQSSSMSEVGRPSPSLLKRGNKKLLQVISLVSFSRDHCSNDFVPVTGHASRGRPAKKYERAESLRIAIHHLTKGQRQTSYSILYRAKTSTAFARPHYFLTAIIIRFSPFPVW